MRLLIGNVLFDGDAREVLRGGRAVPLTRKAFDLFELLLAARPRVVTKDEIHEALWPETFVAESSVQGLVSEIRRVLGDDARKPHLVRTVWGIGYAFAGEADEDGPAEEPGQPRASSPPCLVRGRLRIPLFAGATFLGRDVEPVAAFAEASISRRHARVVVEGERATLEDLGSKNGTFVEGERVVSPTLLDDGAEVRLGLVTFTFRAARRAEPTKTVR